MNFNNSHSLLMIPGPTPIPDFILQELAKHPIGHRSTEFSEILKECYEGLKKVFRTNNDVFIYSSSGTGAMCAAIENLINPNDRVLCCVIGNFGARFKKIAQGLGALVDTLEVEPGEVISPEILSETLKQAQIKDKFYKAVILTHSETSTSAANDVQSLCKIISEYGILSIVDGITSLCAMECKMDDWGIDVLIGGSQKGFMLPPGLSFLCASPRAMQIAKQTTRKSYYFDFWAHKEAIQKSTTPYTPAITLIFGLHKALKYILDQGIQTFNRTHKIHALSLRSTLRDLGLKLLVQEDKKASFSVTAIYPPEGISVNEIRSFMKKNNIVIANGQGSLQDKIFRIGTLGYIKKEDISLTLQTLQLSLHSLGFDCGSQSAKNIFEDNLKKFEKVN